MSSTQSAEQLLQDMIRPYCELGSSEYPDMKKLREVLTQLSDDQKLHILQQEYLVCGTPLRFAASRGHTEIINTLLTSLQSSAYRLKLLMVEKLDTPLHTAAFFGHTDSVKMILNCLTADQQIQLISVRNGASMTAIQMADVGKSVQESEVETAIQKAERGRHTAIVRALREYQQRADYLVREQQRIDDEKTRQQLSGINSQPIIVAVVIIL